MRASLRSRPWRWTSLFLGAIVLAFAVPASAQRFRFGGRMGYQAPYDGKFNLARLTYARFPGWSYDWPEMEQNLGNILSAITAIDPNFKDGNIFDPADPEMMKHPVAYLSEPGYWFPSDEEVKGLQDYLAKGGFLIIDDFHYQNEWNVFDGAIHQVLPEAQIVRLDLTHPIFNVFFSIKSLDIPHPQSPVIGEFYGIYENNDPTRRLVAVIDYNTDIGDYMEWSDRGTYAVAPTNEAFKFMINYLVYGLTH